MAKPLRAALLSALLILAALCGGLLLRSGASAEPGSKEDPLATVGYVQRKAQFVRRTLPAEQSLRLGVGCELIVVDPPYTTLGAGQLDPRRDMLVDLSTGRLVEEARLESLHHYVNGSAHDVFVSLDKEATVLLRGEWK